MRLSRRARRLRLSSAFLTAVWLALCWLYIGSEVGWPVLTQLLPHEIGLVVTGVLAPLALLWAMTLAEMRADEMAVELSRQVSLLLAAPSAALGQVESGADTLERRARRLTSLGEEAAQHLERAAARLEGALTRGDALRLQLEEASLLLAEQLERAGHLAEASGRQLAEWREAAAVPLPKVEPPALNPIGEWWHRLQGSDFSRRLRSMTRSERE